MEDYFPLKGSIVSSNLEISDLEADHTHPLICILLEELEQFSNFAFSLLMKRLNLSKLRGQAGHTIPIIFPNGGPCLENCALLLPMGSGVVGGVVLDHKSGGLPLTLTLQLAFTCPL